MKFVKLTKEGWLEKQGYLKKILLTEKDLKSKGNIVQIIKNKAHTEIKPHFHQKMTEIYHILKGNALIFCGDIRVRANPGDTLLCEPGEVHGLNNDSDQDFLFIVFKINACEDDMTWISN
ncbi:cupin domain-containing protein [Candidatus Bathyarchaeota archaeon]|nr:cupin domain-containing protein [Candidatus Bathyarchaeota archaeon]